MLLRLDGRGARYAQITRALIAAIRSGALEPGARVPATRELARDLGCARNLVLLAYEQLVLEGYLTPRRGAGTFVSSDLPARTAAPAGAERRAPRTSGLRLSRRGRRIAEIAARTMETFTPARGVEIDFLYGLSEPDPRMVASIRKALGAVLRQAPFGYPERAGDARLRQQIAVRLGTARAVRRSPDRVVVTSGTQQALDICARLLLDQGDRVVIEDPAYDGARSVLAAAGARIVRVPVDRQGLVVQALPGDGPPVRLVYVTPSHQFPTGAVLSAARRYSLLAWARRHGAYIFEDDYDCEFRYAGQPLEALAAHDDERVIYCGTFAKSVFPSLRLGYLSLPAALVPAAVGCRWLSDFGSPVILQRLLAELMASGAYDRHIRRMLRRFRARRDAVVTTLRAELGTAIDVEGADGGLHVIVRFRELPAPSVDTLVAACRTRGIGIYSARRGVAVSTARVRGRDDAAILLGYGQLSIDQIERGIRALADAYRRLTASRREA